MSDFLGPFVSREGYGGAQWFAFEPNRHDAVAADAFIAQPVETGMVFGIEKNLLLTGHGRFSYRANSQRDPRVAIFENWWFLFGDRPSFGGYQM